jgi:hypothetical protein
VFDSLILAERSRAQAQSDAVGNDPAGLNSGGDGGQGGAGGGQPIIIASSQSGAGGGPSGAGATAAGRTVNGPGIGGNGSEEETFPVPEDIPSGRDDDVVARQLREAAMREPDPELREKLWDEYRNYTGLSR